MKLIAPLACAFLLVLSQGCVVNRETPANSAPQPESGGAATDPAPQETPTEPAGGAGGASGEEGAAGAGGEAAPSEPETTPPTKKKPVRI